MSEDFDILVRNGNVIDGTGNLWFKKDIGIADGRIRRVGSIPESGRKTIDAKGMVVSPGFIDLHNHSDFSILAYPNAECYITQGVTTVVVGNCGHSLAPIRNPDNLALLRNYLAPLLVSDFDYGWNWKTLGEYYEKIQQQGISLNMAPLAGQGAIRLAVKGFDSNEASREEIGEMKKLLEESLEDGAFGMSTGLIYPPGSYSSTEELIELASVLTKYGAIYATHMRHEGDRLAESLEEAIRIGEENNIAVEIAHHKAAGKANWGKVNASLRAMERARSRGVEVNCDVYPYTAGSSLINATLPTWVLEGGAAKMLERLKDEEVRQQIKKEIAEDTMKYQNMIAGSGWDGIVISECPSKREYEGKSLQTILREKNRFDEPYEGFFDWLLEIEASATMVVFQMDEDDVKTVMRSPLSSIASDSWGTAPAAGGKPHPRAYGTFPRVLGKYVREEKVLTLEEAIRKMTSLPGGKLGLESRGIIREGFWADIVVFDPDKIKDKATYADPHQYAEGIGYVIVNGQVVVENGRLTGMRPGKVLSRC
ncbi:MAG: D-aminoacylase [Chloroflexi bacterium]|nr:D-aminoacylase [Chloroflexota bacterium]